MDHWPKTKESCRNAQHAGRKSGRKKKGTFTVMRVMCAKNTNIFFFLQKHTSVGGERDISGREKRRSNGSPAAAELRFVSVVEPSCCLSAGGRRTERVGGPSFAGLESMRRKGKKTQRQKQTFNDSVRDRLNTDDQAASCVSGFPSKFISAVPKTQSTYPLDNLAALNQTVYSF